MKKLFIFFTIIFTSLAMSQEAPLLPQKSWDAVDTYHTYTIQGHKNFSSLNMLGTNVKSGNIVEKYYLNPSACSKENLKLTLADSNNELTDQFFVYLFKIKSKYDFFAYSICYNIKPNELIFINMQGILPKDLIQNFSIVTDNFITKIPFYGASIKTIDQLRDDFYLTDYYISPSTCTKKTGYLITLTRDNEISSSSFVDLINPKSKDESIAVEMCKIMPKILE